MKKVLMADVKFYPIKFDLIFSLKTTEGLGLMIIEGAHKVLGKGIFVSDLQQGSLAHKVNDLFNSSFSSTTSCVGTRELAKRPGQTIFHTYSFTRIHKAEDIDQYTYIHTVSVRPCLFRYLSKSSYPFLTTEKLAH